MNERERFESWKAATAVFDPWHAWKAALAHRAAQPAGVEPQYVRDMRAALTLCAETMAIKQCVTMWEQDSDRAKFNAALQAARLASKGEAA